ncbi:hypothetical protein IBE76_10250, partial [Francisella tularensis]|uniref:hypothetical protein n=1 Tax=Francisella tularensis TaxID=263 RepID=UPI001C0E958B
DLVNFPYDNLLVAIVSIIFLKIFIISQAATKDIEENIKDVMSSKHGLFVLISYLYGLFHTSMN